jgi:hypothetical protein
LPPMEAAIKQKAMRNRTRLRGKSGWYGVHQNAFGKRRVPLVSLPRKRESIFTKKRRFHILPLPLTETSATPQCVTPAKAGVHFH